eukprot:Tamp_15673.p3 GENE.Tamp_15673~~Tamp_15673.p3  ORF type:complete len:140 (-),score=16.45 Tamp_15673:989-1408(-)
MSDQLSRIPSFERTPSATVKTVERMYNEGVRMKLLGDTDEAERCFRECLKRKADYIPAMLGLGGLLREQGNEEEGKSFINQATVAIVNPPTLKGEAPAAIRRAMSAPKAKSNVNTVSASDTEIGRTPSVGASSKTSAAK